ncbi:enolase C-terminal domain-like protein [Prolixibacter sp. NT017]|uniref:enolase C-terminal domain-like protein n=1 Tax=Prolixibacter sp. NT017 TaxID=2652390 RepID=UPI00127B23FA|nr:enolase C-terminal domain-like protein [Prolixibacter sp. NT017]GET27626.1 L-Ala-D/L-Glu epimerase [Prolixibacter sp. NT017]
MQTNRRNFLKAGLLTGAGVAAAPVLQSCRSTEKRNNMKPGDRLEFSFQPYELQLKHVFTLASSSRTTTPVMLTKIRFGDYVGYGEASMPPYLGESHETAAAFYRKLNLTQFNDPMRMEEIIDYVDNIAPGNHAAKCSIDIALHDLVGKMLDEPWYRLWGFSKEKAPSTSFTIGIDTPEVVKEKTREAAGFNILKIKLGRGTDREIIKAVRSVTDVPVCVDVNQGWEDKQEALDMVHFLNENGCVFVEQPMPKDQPDDVAWLTENSPLPIMADEAVQDLADMKKIYGVYSGVNIKLEKCGGLRHAHMMMNTARTLDMKVMIGCMTATSCAVTAGAQLSPFVDWADLDGNLLIKNDVFEGLKVEKGKIVLPDAPGIGIQKVSDIDI